MEYENSMWYKVGNKCLDRAHALLESETHPSATTAEAIKQLVDAAVSIDMLNYLWTHKSQFSSVAVPGQPFSLRSKEN